MNFLQVITLIGVVLSSVVGCTRAGPFSAASVAEGSCKILNSSSLLANGQLQGFAQTALSVTTLKIPVASSYFFRKRFEWIQRREATSLEELENANFESLLLSGTLRKWNLYNKTAAGQCLLSPNNVTANALGFPNYNCTLSEMENIIKLTVLGVTVYIEDPYLPLNTISDSYTFIWASQTGTTYLGYSCTNNTQEWQVWIYGDGIPFNVTLLEEIDPIIESLGFNKSLKQFAT